ncbi:MAG: sugar phosphate isomerase/epimerase [Cephaloticoccus sp.]|nr:sugar phosphate isomerase/epimerase [Cephaloticoccus sp.]MCF7761268.1 sugar phosphate isomerase/epimerase [Cephaloticoccus sp.]
MKLSQVAAQLYTVRDQCQTAPALAATAKRLRGIGYTAVQVSGIGPIPAAEVVSIMQGEGLKICATHEPSQQILDEPERVVDQLHKLGCNLTAYPYPAGIDFGDAAQVMALVRKLDAAGAVLRAAGMQLGYHNHAIEFVKLQGAPVLDYIYAHTAPENLVGEIDTYWIHYGGGDVVEWVRKLRGRQPFIHLKDYGFTTENKHKWCEIGAGTLPFARIITEAEAGGCEWFIVEQDTCPGDPVDSLRQSFDYIKANLVS